MYNRKIRLLRALVQNETLSSADLMERLCISQRALRTEIRELNDILKKDNICIHSLNMGGYYVNAEDQPGIRKCLDDMISQSKQIVFPETPNERFLFCFTWLFFLKGPVSIHRAAERLCVSNTAMLHTKKRIQDTVKGYPGISLETEKRGMRLCGREDQKRHILAQFINYSTFGSVMMERIMTFLFGSEKYEHYMILYRRLPVLLATYGYRFIDKSIEGLALDIFICLMRNEQGFLLNEKKPYSGNPCIESICEFLEEMGYCVPEKDRAYLEECMKTKRIFYTVGAEYEIPKEYISITEEFLSATDKKYHTEYHKNQELSMKLSIHIMKMVGRIQEGYFDTNTVLEDITSRYGMEMEMAEGINPILQREFHLTANIHEISYIAVYLRAYLSRKLKAIVLCDHGEGIADNMIRQITHYCGEKIRILETMSLAEYRLNPVPVDILISSFRIYNVKLPKNTKIIYVNYLLKKDDLKKIQEYLIKNN